MEHAAELRFTVEAVDAKDQIAAADICIGIPYRAQDHGYFNTQAHSGKSSRHLLDRIAVRVEEVAREELDAFLAMQAESREKQRQEAAEAKAVQPNRSVLGGEG